MFPMTVNKLLTTWGEKLKKEPDRIPLDDYPRPQLKRKNWQNLNGWWEYAFTATNQPPETFQGKIRVPFSPETILSEVERVLQPEEFLWYRREFACGHQKRTILHFGAVDQNCSIYLNGSKIGEHTGGYWPFSFDISAYLQEKNELIVKVQDASDNPIYAYGKQKLNHGQIWYTPQSGIWQTVWLEEVPATYIKNIHFTPRFDEEKIQIELDVSGDLQAGEVEIFEGGKLIQQKTLENTVTSVTLPNFHSWSPKDPFLYTVMIRMGEDVITSYFAMRKFSIKKTAKGTFPLLNNQPIYFNGLLDQGYWSDGLYTPPSDEAMIYDIQQMKKLGFNLLRKHIKIEPLRWYYHCDRLGMLVWQDFVSGGGPYHPLVIQILPFINLTLKDYHYSWFGRKAKESRRQFMKEVIDTINLLKNVPSIAAWVPFNEGWGQFDSLNMEKMVRQMDDTRFLDLVSGYHDQGGGDFKSPHIYFKKYRLKKDSYQRIQVLSEFGGYSLPTPNHMASDKLFGYKKYKTPQEFWQAYEALYRNEIFPAIGNGLSGTIYTQVSDVEDEINGLLTFDRKILKVSVEKMQQLNQGIESEFTKMIAKEALNE